MLMDLRINMWVRAIGSVYSTLHSASAPTAARLFAFRPYHYEIVFTVLKDGIDLTFVPRCSRWLGCEDDASFLHCFGNPGNVIDGQDEAGNVIVGCCVLAGEQYFRLPTRNFERDPAPALEIWPVLNYTKSEVFRVEFDGSILVDDGQFGEPDMHEL